MSHRWKRSAIVAIGFASLLPAVANAAFNQAVIDEVMTSYGGDPSKQFVEIRMLSGGQTVVGGSVLAAFDTSGSYTGDVLTVPTNISIGGAGVRWIWPLRRWLPRRVLPPTSPSPQGCRSAVAWSAGANRRCTAIPTNTSTASPTAPTVAPPIRGSAAPLRSIRSGIVCNALPRV